MKSAPLKVWLQDEVTPVVAGELSWDEKTMVGKFMYEKSFMESKKRFALDPVKLPLKNSQFKETANHGIFGVIRDSGPDSWGRDRLKSQLGELDAFDYLLRAGSDGVGAISMSERDSPVKYYTLEDLD